MKYLPILVLAIVIAWSQTAQAVCQRDPVSGQCPGLTQSPEEAVTDYVYDNYSADMVIDVGCNLTPYGQDCHVLYQFFGHTYALGCELYENPDATLTIECHGGTF